MNALKNTYVVAALAAVAALVGVMAWRRVAGSDCQGSIRNDAAMPRLPAMPAMPSMPAMPTMPGFSGAAPNAPRMWGG
jgi:hypothetical protein